MFIKVTPRYGGNIAGNVGELYVNVDNIRDISFWHDTNVQSPQEAVVITIHFMNGTTVEIGRTYAVEYAREMLWEVFATARQIPI